MTWLQSLRAGGVTWGEGRQDQIKNRYLFEAALLPSPTRASRIIRDRFHFVTCFYLLDLNVYKMKTRLWICVSNKCVLFFSYNGTETYVNIITTIHRVGRD